MPAQAAANDLELHPIQPELRTLQSFSTLVSLHIPFMKIPCNHTYDILYKATGACVKLPASVDDICEILPWIPDEAYLCPMKLTKNFNTKVTTCKIVFDKML